ncbi:MAG TPA: membrane dipeptidase, partial [Chitinophagaceae bacterium]
MQYFDFHTHVLLKQLFDDNPNIDTRIQRSDVAGIPQACTDLPTIIQSQVHQSQLADFADEIIVGATLYSLESYLAREVIPLRQHLKSSSQHKLSLTLLQGVVNNTVTAFTHFLMERTLDRYLNAPESFNVLTKQSFNGPLPKNKVNVFFVIEGCHSLVDSHNEFIPGQKSFPPAEILANLDILLRKVKIVAINPTHMQQSNLCNHAFGIQITATAPFYARGSGLTNEGRTVIQGIFDRGICVDVKHMSYRSRWDLRNEIDNGNFSNPQPLLCTHAGFTGVPFSDWAGYISRKRSVEETFYLEVAKSMHTRNMPRRPGAPAFNSTTINLFDEEIVWIVRHGGMIGLSMDRRILGYVDKFDNRPTGIDQNSPLMVDKEYISKTEWAGYNIPNSRIGKLIDEGDCVTRT